MATVKHLISRSFLKCGVSAVTIAAHKHFLNKIESNLRYTRFITFAVVPKRGNEGRGPTSRLIAPGQRRSEETLQRWRAGVPREIFGPGANISFGLFGQWCPKIT